MYFNSHSLFSYKTWIFSLKKYAPFEESCHLESKMRKQLPFKLLRYLIYLSKYVGKSDIVSLYVRTCVRFSRKTGFFFQIQRNVSPRKQVAWTNAILKIKMYPLVLEIWGKIGNGQFVCWYVNPIFPQNRRCFF